LKFKNGLGLLLKRGDANNTNTLGGQNRGTSKQFRVGGAGKWDSSTILKVKSVGTLY